MSRDVKYIGMEVHKEAYSAREKPTLLSNHQQHIRPFPLSLGQDCTAKFFFLTSFFIG
jgi:hypothetical protein